MNDQNPYETPREPNAAPIDWTATRIKILVLGLAAGSVGYSLFVAFLAFVDLHFTYRDHPIFKAIYYFFVLYWIVVFCLFIIVAIQALRARIHRARSRRGVR